MTEFESYRVFIEGVCKAYGIEGAIAPLQEGVKALEEAHKDRTTGGNWFGKTLRDQNEYDRYVRLGRKADVDKTKTMATTADYDNRVPVSAGKGWDQYGLGDDGFKDTGENTGMSKFARRRPGLNLRQPLAGGIARAAPFSRLVKTSSTKMSKEQTEYGGMTSPRFGWKSFSNART